VTQDWKRINAHLITLNVKLFESCGKVQWLDGANVRPNYMSPNSFPWRYSLADRKWERKGHPHYRQQDSPQKLEDGAKSMTSWLQSLFDNSIVKENEKLRGHMFDVCDDCTEWQMQPLYTFEDSLPGNFVLFKFEWIADQTVDTVGTAEATEFFLGTSPLDIVPIALAMGLSKIRTDAFDYEERVDNPAAYVAKGPMSRYSPARTYADPSRLFAECAPQDAIDKMQELCEENAACIRTYLRCRGFRKNETMVNQRSWDTCFKPSEFRIEELWLSVGEAQDTAKAVSYFMVPKEMTCCKTAEAIQNGKDGLPHVMFNNDSLKRFHPDPENRWAVNAWDTRNAYAIEY
jgi:hypothetical protein